jgi:transposase-like protein
VTRPSKFAPEFRARAIDLYRSSEGRTIADVARELGIGTETFRSGCAKTRRIARGTAQAAEPAAMHPLPRLLQQAGNAAVAWAVSVQREEEAGRGGAPISEEDRFDVLQLSGLYRRDPDVSSVRNHLIEVYERVASHPRRPTSPASTWTCCRAPIRPCCRARPPRHTTQRGDLHGQGQPHPVGAAGGVGPIRAGARV